MKYSIITINYNNCQGLRRTIESVINQTYRDFEYIIIDGGSTDGSVEDIKEYLDYIDYWVSEPDKGIYNAMNKGIFQAKGEYLNFMNSGDCFYSYTTLQNLTDKKISADIIIGKDYHINNKNQEFSTIFPKRLSMVTFYTATLPHQSSFFSRKLFLDYQYDEKYKIVSDWLFYIKKIVLENCSVKYYHDLICKKEPNGFSGSETLLLKNEWDEVLNNVLPKVVSYDYEKLKLLDRSTIYKLYTIMEDKLANKILTYFIKILYRIFRLKEKESYNNII